MALETLNLDEIKTDVAAAVSAVQSVATFVEKFESVLPANVRSIVDELQAALTFVEAVLAKV